MEERDPNVGKKIKAIPNDRLQYVDVKTGETYESEQVISIPDVHAVCGGIQGKHFGVFLLARAFWPFYSFQFGVSIDAITRKDGDKCLDIELRVACFGVGIRFMKLANFDTKCKD